MRGLKFLVVEGNKIEVRERVISHLGHDPGVEYGELLRGLAPGATYDIFYGADLNKKMPTREEIRDYDGVVIGGSALNLPEFPLEAERQVDFAKRAFEAGIPFFGSCWGLQLASCAAGGKVVTAARGREMCFARNIHIVADHPLLSGRPPAYDAVGIHVDEVEVLPKEARLLAGNAHSRVQAAEIHHEEGVFWGVQYHPEYSLFLVAGILSRLQDALLSEGFFANKEELESHKEDLIRAHAGERHVSWRLGIGDEILNKDRRVLEIGNWIEYMVRPRAN
ncbi:MAG: type 1 glutamine amidotransferase [Alphaproteobacteria bacterium]